MNKSFLKSISLLFLIAFIFSSCAVVPRQRTLPQHIRSVYIPMFQNQSYEPGLEELITSYAIDEFLADGRLQVVQKSNADIIITGTIRKYYTQVSDFEDDEFPSASFAEASANVAVEENFQPKRKLAEFGNVKAKIYYTSDPRRIIEDVDVDVKDKLMRELARRIVLEVIKGDYQQ